MTRGAVASAAEADHRHAGRHGSLDPDRAVLNDDAVLVQHIELPRCEQKKIGCRLAPLDLRGAEDVRIEKRQQTSHRKGMPHPVEMAVRSDATRR